MVKRLVAKGADIHNRDSPFNSTPLSWAQHNKQRAVFDWMRANCAIDLHEAVRLLLDHGADPNIVAGDGNAPLDVARTSGARRIVALLEERGARSAAEL